MKTNEYRKHQQTTEKNRRKFVAIAKVKNNPEHFVKYRFNDLNNFLEFIKRKYPGVLFINVFSNKGINKNMLLYTWGSKKGLQNAY